MKIYDDFLPQEMFDWLFDLFLSEDFPWLSIQGITYATKQKSSEGIPSKYDLQMTHPIYSSGGFNFDNDKCLSPLLQYVEDKLDLDVLVRAKLNITHISDKNYDTGFHSDMYFEDKPYQTAILYFNTTDGKTLFENGTEVDCVKNRLILFDGYDKHAGTMATDSNFRMVLNLNYV